MKDIKFRLLIGVMVFAILAAPALILAQPEKPQEKLITIKARQFSYDPNIIEVNRGDRITIRFISTDVHHGLYIDGYELETNARPGQDGSITFTANSTGKFAMRCSVTCGPFHPYMVGYLRVKPDYRLYGSISLALVMSIVSMIFVSRREKK